MAFIIPNAADTLTSPYAVLDQAEPDSLDFEILGNSSRSGVVRGGEVTANGTGGVAVSAGVAVVNGVPYSFDSRSFNLGTNPSTKRFDVVVFRVGSGIISITGTEDATNPTFPRSKTITGVAGIDFSTDVVLAAVYRAGNVTTSQIIDKRVFITSSIVDQGSSAPISSYGAGTGSLFYKTGAPDGSASGVYVKTSTAGWIELAQNVGPHVPIGGMLAWPSRGAIPTGFVEANGQSLSTTLYPALFSVLGYTWGGSGLNFNVPNFNNKFVRGTTTSNTVGTNSGANSVTISVNQIPIHEHTIAHTHTVAHEHTATHNHGVSTDGKTGGGGDHGHNHALTVTGEGDHTHGASTNFSANNLNEGGHNHSVSTQTNPGAFTFRGAVGGFDNNGKVFFSAVNWNVASNYTNDYYWSGVAASGNTTSVGGHNHTVSVGNSNSHNHGVGGSITAANAHQHNVSVNPSNSSTGESTPTTAGLSANITGSTGGNTAVSLVPDSSFVRWIIRASYGTSTAAIGGNSLLDEALEEVVTVELVGSGSLPSSQVGAAYYRMPWAATLTGVKANRNGTNTNGSVTIDINEAGTTVLSTKLTIDQNESSSLTAATAPVISDPTIANDALLTFDIDAANTGDSGPLTVTLYFSRVA